MNIHSTYLKKVYDVSEFSKIVEVAIPLAKRIRSLYQFDTIAFSGYSGAAISYILSAELHVPLICIRKHEEKSHFNFNGIFEGNLNVKKYLIVDDFICTGSTVRHIQNGIYSKVNNAKCVAYLLYSGFSGSPAEGEYYETPFFNITKKSISFDQMNFNF